MFVITQVVRRSLSAVRKAARLPMAGPRPMTAADVRSRRRIRIGLLLLVAGLLGHLFAARAIRGSYVAYRDHIFGFILLSLVSGAVIAALGLRFLRGGHDITLVGF